MSSLVDVMDDFAKVGLKVSGGQAFKVGKSCRRDVSFPLEVALASLNHVSDSLVFLTEGSKGLGELKLVSRNSTPSSRQSQVLLNLLRAGLPGQISSLPHVGGEDNQIEVLVDVVHNFHFQESLGGIIHNLVAEFGLSNVLPELLDASATSLGCSIFVNDLVTLILGSSTILESGNNLLNNFKLTPEQTILLGVHSVSVHLEQVQVDSRNSLNKTLKGGIDLELLEEAGNDTASGGPGETNLVIDNDRGVDVRAHKSLADGVKVRLIGSSRVADRNSDKLKSREVSFDIIDGRVKSLEVFHLHLSFFLANVNDLEFSTVL